MKQKYWIGFSSIEQLDSNFVHALYNYFGDIELAFNAGLDEIKNIEGLSVKKAENFLRKRDGVNIDKVYQGVKDRGINVLTLEDSKYPYLLKQISDPPVCLYYKGDLFSCNLERTIAVVGSRRASLSGKESVRKIISDLRNTDICVVSGLASGIDTEAHKSAIDNNLKTIGVIASGFDYTYPSDNKYLYKKLEEGCGAVVSEYYPTFEPLKFRFPQRNRVITGLSYGTIVGEAALRSGALISANLTLEQGRELMCIPGSINNINTEGIYKLIKDGAGIVTRGEDILNILGWEIICKEQNQQKKNLPPSQKIIFDIISVEPKGFDELQTLTGLSSEELLTALSMMEINGSIKQTEGDRYTKA